MKEKVSENAHDFMLAFCLFITFIIISFLTNFTYNFLNRPTYEMTLNEKVIMFPLIIIAYFGTIGLIYFEIKLMRGKLLRKYFFENK